MHYPLQFYSEIFDLEIDHPDHLKHIKEESKNYKGAPMTPQEMWNAYKKINPSIGDEIDALGFWSGTRSLGRFGSKRRKDSNCLSLRPLCTRRRPLPQEGTLMSF